MMRSMIFGNRNMNGRREMNHKELELESHLEQLPDPILQLIFDKVIDAKSLCRCLAISKRLASFIFHVHTIHLTINRREYPNINPVFEESHVPKPENDAKAMTKLLRMLGLLRKKINYDFCRTIDQNLAFSQANLSDGGLYLLPKHALKNFQEIQILHVELPSLPNGISITNDSFLAWKADFKSGFASSMVLLARSFHQLNPLEGNKVEENFQNLSEQSLSNRGLHSRIALAKSCLVDIYLRYYLIQTLFSDHPTLHAVSIRDSNKIGTLSILKRNFVELGNNLKLCLLSPNDVDMSFILNLVDNAGSSPEPSHRLEVVMKVSICFEPLLELPSSGYIMEGATLMTLQPAGPLAEMGCNEMELARAFEEEEKAVCEAVNEMMKNCRSVEYFMLLVESF